jgi:hypothetical protein
VCYQARPSYSGIKFLSKGQDDHPWKVPGAFSPARISEANVDGWPCYLLDNCHQSRTISEGC